MKKHRLRLMVTILALGSGMAFGSIPGNTENVIRTELMIVGSNHETASRNASPSADERSRTTTNDKTPPQTAGDQSLTGLLGLIALGISGALVQLRRPRH